MASDLGDRVIAHRGERILSCGVGLLLKVLMLMLLMMQMVGASGCRRSSVASRMAQGDREEGPHGRLLESSKTWAGSVGRPLGAVGTRGVMGHGLVAGGGDELQQFDFSDGGVASSSVRGHSLRRSFGSCSGGASQMAGGDPSSVLWGLLRAHIPSSWCGDSAFQSAVGQQDLFFEQVQALGGPRPRVLLGGDWSAVLAATSAARVELVEAWAEAHACCLKCVGIGRFVGATQFPVFSACERWTPWCRENGSTARRVKCCCARMCAQIIVRSSYAFELKSATCSVSSGRC